MRHLYIHVPFCARRCVYCDFAIAVRKRIPAHRYVRAVLREYECRSSRESWDDKPLETLYLGGGTPSLLPPNHVAELVCFLRDSEQGSTPVTDHEITLEANPNDVTPVAAAAWARAGVNRVSLGVQSFHAAVLKWMHRTHEADASGRAVRLLRDAGIRSVSLDLIFALPEELHHSLRNDLLRALELEPDHLSVYGLTVEPRTPLARWVSRGASCPPGDARFEDEFLLADEVLTTAGFEHYEVSNYARPNHHSKHNTAYWRRRPYVGLGPSAHSFGNGERSWNLDQWVAYQQAVAVNGDPTAARERLAMVQRRLEELYLGLRTTEGVPVNRFATWPTSLGQAAAQRGWLRVSDQRVRLTPLGWLRLDSIVQFLTTCDEGG